MESSKYDDPTNLGQFFDLQFLPSDSIVGIPTPNDETERYFDVTIHWRRPSEFLECPLEIANQLNRIGRPKTRKRPTLTLMDKLNGDGCHQVYVFSDLIEPRDVREAS
jgi:hypothetical protein